MCAGKLSQQPLPSTGGWLGDHAHVCFIVKIILNLNMCWEDRNMRYTFDLIVVSIGINGFFQLVSILTFLYTHIFCIYMLELQRVSISIGIYFFHTYMFYLCLLYPYILSTNFVYAKLELQLCFNWLVLNWYFFIQAYALFHLVFHKGGENVYFIFQLVFDFHSQTLWMNIEFQFDIICF